MTQFTEEQLVQLKENAQNTLIETLGIEYQELSTDKVVMTMPVGPPVHQPYGVLHGGASVVLAETAASIATAININPETHVCFGMEINANHIRTMSEGTLIATATPFHKGRSTMVWHIDLTNEEGKTICISRCTVSVMEKRK
ncbi:hotdog fold thioesterase [Shouchella sp. JSM 1781072]|uniref:hotdog fold thioesterase n=1 Tax=Bacillaceae TaxID=186817 RepID=UPI000C079FC6|nr:MULTISPECIES: hotdog fold thioesterase [Bacillaceae]UTR07362.1 hotdog fold thioesterase [Alkalihalobacillus sp. LMS6]